jgi:chorismate mutase
MLVEREKDVRAEVDKAAREGKLDEAKMLELFEKFIKLTSKGSSNA